MNKHTKLLALLLTVCFLLSSLPTHAFASNAALKGSFEIAASKGIEIVIDRLLDLVNRFIPDSENFYEKSTYKSENFLAGTSEIPADSSVVPHWRLGSADASIVPGDWQTHPYCIGGFLSPYNNLNNHADTLLDDLRVRVIAIDDGTERGIAVFATVDCIGITNKDIRQIRALLSQSMPDTTFAGITVCATHCHSGIDTEGLWTDILRKAPMNLARTLIGMGDLETGTDPHFMEFLYRTVADTMLQAVKRMTSGTLSYAAKDIGDDYFHNKNRKSATALMTDMSRFVFTPDDDSVRPTMIVNIAAHPDIAGYPTKDRTNSGRGISGDYVYYMGKVINGAGYDFMFFNGAIAGIYTERGKTNNGQRLSQRVQQCERYGETLGKIALSLTLTEQQIADDQYLSDDAVEAQERAFCESNGGEYFVWYNDWTPVESVDLPASMDLRFAEVTIPVTNGIICLAGKLNLASYDVLRDENGYYIITEIGFMELGGKVRIALAPGEVCQDLVVGGGSLTAEGSVNRRDYETETICELFGEDTIVFGLANDAIGYIIPDNDYCACGAFDHYQELISLGEHTASTILRAYAELAANV